MYKYLSANSHYAAFLPTGSKGLGMILHSIQLKQQWIQRIKAPQTQTILGCS